MISFDTNLVVHSDNQDSDHFEGDRDFFSRWQGEMPG
jgi:hypothetical protein